MSDDMRLYRIGLLLDGIPGLEHGHCPPMGSEPQDNLTRIRHALKYYENRIAALEAESQKLTAQLAAMRGAWKEDHLFWCGDCEINDPENPCPTMEDINTPDPDPDPGAALLKRMEALEKFRESVSNSLTGQYRALIQDALDALDEKKSS